MLSLRRIERLVSLQSRPEVLGKAVHQMRNDACRNDAGTARKRTQVQVQKDYEGVQMKSSREQFEEWWVAYADKCSHLVEDVEYYAAKDAWQASRAAIEIELPSREDPANFFCEVYDCELVHESLTNCGIKVKS